MSKQSTSSSPLNQTHFSNELENHPAVEWLVENKRAILIGFIALFALILLAYRLISARTVSAENDFFYAQTDFNQFQESAVKPTETAQSREADLQKLVALMDRHPELRAKYDGAIAQTLLIEQNVEQAIPFAQRVFQRTENDGSYFYRAYGETSLVIGAGDYPKAYEQALTLKKQMNEATEKTFGDTLYLFNLIRLAFLQQELNMPQEELQTWNELNQYSANPEALVATYALFTQGQASLSKYAEERKHALK